MFRERSNALGTLISGQGPLSEANNVNQGLISDKTVKSGNPVDRSLLY